MASTGYPLMIRISSGRVEASHLELSYNLILRTLLLSSFYLLLEREYLIKDLLHFSPGPNKLYKQTGMDKQDKCDDSFASKGK